MRPFTWVSSDERTFHFNNGIVIYVGRIVFYGLIVCKQFRPLTIFCRTMLDIMLDNISRDLLVVYVIFEKKIIAFTNVHLNSVAS